MMLFHITMNCANRTITSTFGATNTFFRQHFKYGKFFTSTCRTTMVMYMRYIFIAEILQSRQNGVRCCLTQCAQRVVFNIVAQGFQLLNITVFTSATGDFLQHFQKAFCTNTTSSTFTAGLINSEAEKELCDVNHTCGFIHNN